MIDVQQEAQHFQQGAWSGTLSVKNCSLRHPQPKVAVAYAILSSLPILGMQQNFATFQEIERITNIFELFFFLFFFPMKGSHVPNEIRAEIHEKFHNSTSISNLVEEYELHCTTVHRIIAERYRCGCSHGKPKIVTQREWQRILAYM